VKLKTDHPGTIFAEEHPTNQPERTQTMALSNEEAIASLNATNETLGKVSAETDALLKEIQRLNDVINNLPTGTISPELEAAIAAVDTRAKAIDDLVADVPPPAK
jgi:hypothetical protein